MDDFSNNTKFSKEFLHKTFENNTFLDIKHSSSDINLRLKGKKFPNPHISSSMLLKYSNLIWKAKSLSDRSYYYKFLYFPQTIPLFLTGKFHIDHLSEETLIKNSLIIEYKHDLLNFAIRLKDNPINISIKATTGTEKMRFHSVIKSDLRLKKMLKFVIGSCYSKENIKVIGKYYFLTNDIWVWYQQSISSDTIFVNSIRLNSFFKLAEMQIGMIHNLSSNTCVKVKAGHDGKVFLACLHRFTQRLKTCFYFSTDANKFARSSFDYNCGVKIDLNI